MEKLSDNTSIYTPKITQYTSESDKLVTPLILCTQTPIGLAAPCVIVSSIDTSSLNLRVGDISSGTYVLTFFFWKVG